VSGTPPGRRRPASRPGGDFVRSAARVKTQLTFIQTGPGGYPEPAERLCCASLLSLWSFGPPFVPGRAAWSGCNLRIFNYKKGQLTAAPQIGGARVCRVRSGRETTWGLSQFSPERKWDCPPRECGSCSSAGPKAITPVRTVGSRFLPDRRTLGAAAEQVRQAGSDQRQGGGYLQAGLHLTNLRRVI
jgi:hypothetical protein